MIPSAPRHLPLKGNRLPLLQDIQVVKLLRAVLHPDGELGLGAEVREYRNRQQRRRQQEQKQSAL